MAISPDVEIINKQKCTTPDTIRVATSNLIKQMHHVVYINTIWLGVGFLKGLTGSNRKMTYKIYYYKYFLF